MKKVVVAFARQRYVSASNGNPLLYPIIPNMMEVMGGADDMRWEITIFAVSSANARMQISLFEGTRTEPRPSASPLNGTALGSAFPTDAALSAGVITPVQVAAPFSAVVDAVMKVWQTGSPTTQEWVDMEVRLTTHST